jgi:hypothetical protein
MDTAGGCIASLYNDRIVQSTGFIYDCYFLDASEPVDRKLRARFEEEIHRNPPRFFVVTDSVCFGGARSFDKFSNWPWLSQELSKKYTIKKETHFTTGVRYWSRVEIPYNYRIYERTP